MSAFDSIDLAVAAPMKVKNGDQEFTLVFDFEATKRAEDKLDLNLNDPRVWSKLKIADIVTIMWCGLATHHPDVELKQVQAMVNSRNKLVLKAGMFEQFFPGVIQSTLDNLNKADGALPNVEAPAEAKA
ncbi:MAG TPA: hypothetical protein VFA89_20945 [Terriglobales bacterium]|nr:hypothetical protein [Terriglobales bacterium]